MERPLIGPTSANSKSVKNTRMKAAQTSAAQTVRLQGILIPFRVVWLSCFLYMRMLRISSPEQWSNEMNHTRDVNHFTPAPRQLRGSHRRGALSPGLSLSGTWYPGWPFADE